MRFGVDVCVSLKEQLYLFRQGHFVPVFANTSEKDENWFNRALNFKCDCIVTDDKRVQKWTLKKGLKLFTRVQLNEFIRKSNKKDNNMNLFCVGDVLEMPDKSVWRIEVITKQFDKTYYTVRSIKTGKLEQKSEVELTKKAIIVKFVDPLSENEFSNCKIFDIANYRKMI